MIFFNIGETGADTEKAHRIYRVYYNDMYAAAYKILQDSHLAADAVQEAFIRITKNLRKIDESRPNRTRAFVVITCENVAKSMYKKQKQLILPASALPEPPADPLDIEIQKEDRRLAAELVLELDPTYRDPFILHHAQGLTYEETAETLNIPVETAKKRIYRAKQKILENIKERSGDK